MVKLKGALTLFSLMYLVGCTSSNPYSQLGNPSLEKVLMEHAEKVQSLPKQEQEQKANSTPAPKVPKHIEKMYKEWVTMKPQLQKLVELEAKIAAAAQKSKQTPAKKDQREYVSPPITQSKAMNSTPDSPQAKYVIQIGASTSKAGAEKFWRAQQKKYPSFLNNIEPKIEHVMKSGKSVYRVKIGAFIAYRQAERACDSFKMLGGQCIVKKIRKK